MKKLLVLLTIFAISSTGLNVFAGPLDDAWHKLSIEYYETGRVNPTYAAEFNKLRNEGKKFSGAYGSTAHTDRLLQNLGINKAQFHNLMQNR